MKSNDFASTRWDLMDSNAKAAWLLCHILGHEVDEEGQELRVGGKRVELNASLISQCEAGLNPTVKRLYVKNCISEAGVIAYKDLPPDIGNDETAHRFYDTLLMLPLENRAISMYWAVKGENV